LTKLSGTRARCRPTRRSRCARRRVPGRERVGVPIPAQGVDPLNLSRRSRGRGPAPDVKVDYRQRMEGGAFASYLSSGRQPGDGRASGAARRSLWADRTQFRRSSNARLRLSGLGAVCADRV
jgi:hypothetical protein